MGLHPVHRCGSNRKLKRPNLMSGEDLSLFDIESSSDQISNSDFIKIIFLTYFQHAIEIYSSNLAKI